MDPPVRNRSGARAACTASCAPLNNWAFRSGILTDLGQDGSCLGRATMAVLRASQFLGFGRVEKPGHFFGARFSPGAWAGKRDRILVASSSAPYIAATTAARLIDGSAAVTVLPAVAGPAPHQASIIPNPAFTAAAGAHARSYLPRAAPRASPLSHPFQSIDEAFAGHALARKGFVGRQLAPSTA